MSELKYVLVTIPSITINRNDVADSIAIACDSRGLGRKAYPHSANRYYSVVL